CYLWMQRDRIDLVHQKGFCLTTAHHKCPWLMMRRPDAPPPLRQRVRGLVVAGPRLAWGFAFAGLRHVPALARSSGRGLDLIAGRLAWAIRHVTADLARVSWFVVSRLGRALGAVLGDVWTLTQRSNSAVSFAARAIRSTLRGLWWLLAFSARVAVCAVRALRARSRARREANLARKAAPPLPAPVEAPQLAPEMASQPAVDEWQALAELFPELARPEPELPLADQAPPPVAEPILEPVAASAAAIEPTEAITQRLEAPLARFEELLRRLETLVSDGVAALDRGQDELAYQLFLKATQQPAKMDGKAAPELLSQHTSLMTRAWFWRAKTADTVDEVVKTLEQALHYEPENLQIQAHLAWARQRLDREAHVQKGTAQALQPFVTPPVSSKPRASLWAVAGTGVRLLGGLMALALAALWMTTAVMPALGRYLSQLPAGDELLLRRLLLTINATALPGQGHLPLPILHYDLGLSLPFVMAFLFVFTARGLMDGDSWARTTGLLLAGLGGWLCAAAVTNPDASRLGLALCVGIIVAAVAGRFETPKTLSRAGAVGY
ncbi:MAG TPA: hypothetical protein VF157_03735, partial [Chloroflexota bacterium]